MEALTRESPAKLNLTLRVLRKRDDGYHEIESLVTRIGLCDTVSVSERPNGRRTLACNDPSIPNDETNLALKAASALADRAAKDRGVHIEITKRIPAGAGLGGGSSNAATTLMLLNELWRTELTQPELARLGAAIGADVPLFFHEPLCVLRGSGERMEDLNRLFGAWAVVLFPKIHCDTARVYRAWDPGAGRLQRPSLEHVLGKLDRPAELMTLLFNDLEAPALATHPDLAAVARDAASAAGSPWRMTGSGSTYFRLFDDPSRARACATAIHARCDLKAQVVTAGTPS